METTKRKFLVILTNWIDGGIVEHDIFNPISLLHEMQVHKHGSASSI